MSIVSRMWYTWSQPFYGGTVLCTQNYLSCPDDDWDMLSVGVDLRLMEWCELSQDHGIPACMVKTILSKKIHPYVTTNQSGQKSISQVRVRTRRVRESEYSTQHCW